MIEPADNSQPTLTRAPRPVPGRLIPQSLLVPAALVLTALIVSSLSKDWCCAPISLSVLTTLVVWVIDCFLVRTILLERNSAWRLQLLPLLVILGGLSIYFAGSPSREFKRIFGAPVPAGVHDLSLDSSLAAPAGGYEVTILMRFRADPETMEKLILNAGIVVDEELMKQWSAFVPGDSMWLWRQVVGVYAPFGGDAWKNPEPMSDPVAYRGAANQDRYGVRLLWDRASGRVFVASGN